MSQMTSIPVRRGAGVPTKRRSGSHKDSDEHSPPHPGNDKKDPPKTKIRYNSKEDKQDKYRPPTRKELAEENSVLKGEIKDHESRLKELEILLRMEKDKTSALKKSSSKKENEYEENLNNLNQKSDALESKLDIKERNRLLQPVNYDLKQYTQKINSIAETEYHHGVRVWFQTRPHKVSSLIWIQTVCRGYQQITLAVNLKNLDPDNREDDSEKRLEQAMAKVKLIQEKFGELNLQAIENIDTMQEMSHQLDEVVSNCQKITNDDPDIKDS